MAVIHKRWKTDDVFIDINAIYSDLKKMPIKLKEKEIILLKKNFCHLANVKIPIGKVYRDFDPLNIYCNLNKIELIDPSEKTIESYLYWDVATFMVGLRKAYLKNIFSFDIRQKKVFDICRRSFLNEYFNLLKIKKSSVVYAILLIKTLELQRLGELMVFQDKYRRKNKWTTKYLYNKISLMLLR